MTKFNEFENYLIATGVRKAIKELENEIKDAENNNKRHIMASGYPTMIEKDLLEKLEKLTKFYKKKKK
jgi:hypothetical protein